MPDVAPVTANVMEYVNTVEAFGNAQHSSVRISDDGRFVLKDNYSAGTNEITGTWTLSDNTYTLKVESSKMGNYQTILFEVKDNDTLILKTDLLGSKAEQTFSSDPNAEMISLSNDDDFKYGQYNNITKTNSYYRSYIMLYSKGTFSYVDTDNVNSIVIGGKFTRSSDRFTCTYEEGGAKKTFDLQIKDDGTLVLLNELGDSRTGDIFSNKTDTGNPNAEIPCTAVSILNHKPNVDDNEPSWNIQAVPVPENTTDQMYYYSGDTSILEIDQAGNVTVHKAGYTYIQVVCGNAEQTAYLSVNATGPVSVYFDPGVYSIELGSGTQLNAIVQSKNGNEKLTYYSSDPSIVKVSASGYVTGLQLGKASITARTSNGVEGSINVYVNGETVVFNGHDVTIHGDEWIAIPVTAYFIKNHGEWYNKEDIWYELQFETADPSVLLCESNTMALHASDSVLSEMDVAFWYTWSDGSSLNVTSPIYHAHIIP